MRRMEKYFKGENSHLLNQFENLKSYYGSTHNTITRCQPHKVGVIILLSTAEHYSNFSKFLQKISKFKFSLLCLDSA